MQTTTITFNASQIANIIGLFGEKKKREALCELWKKNNPQSYEQAVERHNTGEKDETKHLSVKYTSAVQHGRDLLQGSKAAQDIMGKEHASAADLHQAKRNLLEQGLALATTPQEYAAVRQATENVINTQFGIQKESSALEKFGKFTEMEIETCEKLWRKEYKIENSELSFIVQGKVDGLAHGGDCVVEIKNRVYKLFHVLRDYERIQLQTYLELCNASHGYLVECFKEQIDWQKQERDAQWWRERVFLPCQAVCLDLLALLQNHDIQNDLLARE